MSKALAATGLETRPKAFVQETEVAVAPVSVRRSNARLGHGTPLREQGKGKPISARLSDAKGHVIFQTRATRAIADLLATLDRDALDEAAAAPTDVEVLLFALKQPAVLDSTLIRDPLAEAKLLGQMRRKELLEAEGGVLGPEEVANLLGLRRQSVDKRRKAGTLLALEIGNRFIYPAWQIEGNKTLEHLEEVLNALKHHDEWRKLSFFVNGNVRLGGISPLNSLRAGEYDDVLKAARSLGEHGAA
jgi:hypothetical protein